MLNADMECNKEERGLERETTSLRGLLGLARDAVHFMTAMFTTVHRLQEQRRRMPPRKVRLSVHALLNYRWLRRSSDVREMKQMIPG
jgi:hypothetical protein